MKRCMICGKTEEDSADVCSVCGGALMDVQGEPENSPEPTGGPVSQKDSEQYIGEVKKQLEHIVQDSIRDAGAMEEDPSELERALKQEIGTLVEDAAGEEVLPMPEVQTDENRSAVRDKEDAAKAAHTAEPGEHQQRMLYSAPHIYGQDGSAPNADTYDRQQGIIRRTLQGRSSGKDEAERGTMQYRPMKSASRNLAENEKKQGRSGNGTMQYRPMNKNAQSRPKNESAVQNEVKENISGKAENGTAPEAPQRGTNESMPGRAGNGTAPEAPQRGTNESMPGRAGNGTAPGAPQRGMNGAMAGRPGNGAAPGAPQRGMNGAMPGAPQRGMNGAMPGNMVNGGAPLRSVNGVPQGRPVNPAGRQGVSNFAGQIREASRSALKSPIFLLIALLHTVYLAGSVASIFMHQLNYSQFARLLSSVDLPQQVTGYMQEFVELLGKLDSGAVPVNLAMRVPDLLFCLGLWIIAISAMAAKERMSGVGFVFTKIVVIIGMIKNCLIMLAGLIVSVVLVVGAWASQVQNMIVASVVTIVLMIVLTMMVIMYYFSFFGTLTSIRRNADTGESYGRVSGYVAVLHILMGLLGIVSLLSGIVNAEIAAIVGAVGKIGWMVLFGLWIMGYRKKVQQYEK